MLLQSLGPEDPLEEGMAIIPIWRILLTEEPDCSLVGHKELDTTEATDHTRMHAAFIKFHASTKKTIA